MNADLAEYYNLITALSPLCVVIRTYPDAAFLEDRWSVTILIPNQEPKTTFGSSFLEAGWKALGR